MKSVLISIQPKWCELIASGKKTIEVRKTATKMKTPFKCYIYCTKEYDGSYLYINEPKAREHGMTMRWSANAQDTQDYGFKGNSYLSYKANGKVIGEFICDRIYDILPHDDGYDINQYECGWKCGEDDSCLTFNEFRSYLGINNGYGWHISDLVIYDTPRELGEFRGYCAKKKECYADVIRHCDDTHFDWKCNPLTRPPQSWGYVEEV